MTDSINPVQRHRTVGVPVGPVQMGGDAPIVVQSMTNTDTTDVEGTVTQVAELADAGSEVVRITVNTESAAAAVPYIREALDTRGYDVPLVGDFHFNGHKLLAKQPACAEALAKLRINPGNVGKGSRRDDQFAQMIEYACYYDRPVRIGVNWGSLDQDLMARLLDENQERAEPKDLTLINREAVVESAISSARYAERLGLPRERIVLSCKMSGAQDLIAVYRELARQSDYALHLGLTEAGTGTRGIVASTAALSVLLQEGIGDTIRSFTPAVVACPGCGRTTSTYFQELAESIQGHIRQRMPEWKHRYPGVEDMRVAVMGCVVNGPGESRNAHIGISLPGTGERPVAPVYIDGEKSVTLKGDNIADDFQALVEDYVERTYGGGDDR